MLKHKILIFGISLGSFYCSAQYYNFPSEYGFALETEKQLSVKEASLHTGLKPYVHFFSDQYAAPQKTDSSVKSKLLQSLFYTDLLRVHSPKEEFHLRINPILNLEAGRDLSDSSGSKLYTNGRGIIAAGSIGQKVYFETLFCENQSFFPAYISNFADATLVAPGQGRHKKFKETGYDYAFSSGFISVQLFKNINLQIGHGKQKVGHGYRSLLLSDNAFNYPYLRLTQQWLKGKLQYTNIYSVFMDLVPASVVINPNTERLFKKKCASFQYLSYNPVKSVNIGLFQGLIWQAADDHNKQNLDFRYFNPLIFANTALMGLDNANNVLVGTDLKIKLGNKSSVYGQFMLDKLSSASSPGDHFGYQTGLVVYDAFRIKQLTLQMEYNYVSDGSYSAPDGAAATQAYSHYRQVLAYTPVNGSEIVGMADYRFKRFFVSGRLHLQQHGAGTNNSNKTDLVNAKIGFVINPAYNLNLCAGAILRNQNFYNFKTSNTETSYFYIGFRTSIYNLYYDF